jgi:hypothetical protein
MEELRQKMAEGGPREAALRALVYVRMPEKFVDERSFAMLRRIREEHGAGKTLDEFKQDLRDQYFMLRLDEQRAVNLISTLMKGKENEWPEIVKLVERVATAAGPLGKKGQSRLDDVKRLVAVPGQAASKQGADKATNEASK